MSKKFFCAILAGLLVQPASAAQIPRQFHGVWAQTSDKACKPADWQAHERDDLIQVETQSVNYWEGACDFASVKALGENTSDLALTCNGEGETWKSREVWYVTKVAQQRQLITVSMSRSDDKKHKIGVTVYVECK